MTYTQPPSEPPPLNAAQTIAPALRYMWAMLTRPFSLRKWLALALVTLVAGMLPGGGSFNLPVGGEPPKGGSTQQFEPYVDALAQWARENLALLVALGAALLLLTIAGIYLAAVFRFVFLDSVARNRVAVNRAFVENWDRGLSLFLWWIGSTLAFLILLGVPLALMLLPFAALFPAFFQGGAPAAGLVVLAVLAAIAAALVGLALFVALTLIGVTLADFVLPAMYLEHRGIWSAWGRVIRLIRRQPGPFAFYFLLKIPVGIAAGIAAMLLGAVAIFVALIPVGILGLAGVLIALAAHMAWAWTPATVFLVAFGGGLVLVYLVYAASCATLPVPVFRQAWALAFLGERDRSLAVLKPPEHPRAA